MKQQMQEKVNPAEAPAVTSSTTATETTEETKTFEGGFFQVSSPVKTGSCSQERAIGTYHSSYFLGQKITPDVGKTRMLGSIVSRLASPTAECEVCYYYLFIFAHHGGKARLEERAKTKEAKRISFLFRHPLTEDCCGAGKGCESLTEAGDPTARSGSRQPESESRQPAAAARHLQALSLHRRRQTHQSSRHQRRQQRDGGRPWRNW